MKINMLDKIILLRIHLVTLKNLNYFSSFSLEKPIYKKNFLDKYICLQV